MDLQKVDTKSDARSLNNASTSKRILFYRHPMRGDVSSQVPAKDEMGMDYIPVYEDAAQVDESSDVDGRAGFSLPKFRQQQIGVTKAKVEKKSLVSEIRAAGKVAFDPDLYAAVDEYRQAVLSAESLKNSSYEVIREQAKETIESTRTKLRLLGLSEQQIKNMVENKAAAMNLLLPKGKAWIYSEIFEYELPQLKEGQQVEVTTPTLPGKIFQGKIVSIASTINPQTRTGRVRALVPDSEGLLRPDSFVDVTIKADLGERTVVPDDSVLRSGSEDFVFVVSGESFEPRRVVLGIRTQDYIEIVSGVTEDEEVVSSANFLIDSESRLRSVIKNLRSQNSSPDGGGQMPNSGAVDK